MIFKKIFTAILIIPIVGIFYSCALWHPPITITSYEFDIENDCLKEGMMYYGDNYITIEINGRGIIELPNGKSLEAKRLEDFSIKSPAKNTVLYFHDRNQIFYPTERKFYTCCDHGWIMTLPLTTEHRNRFSTGVYNLNKEND